MNDIEIKRVQNGWVAHPHSPHLHPGIQGPVFVYTNITDLRAALPELLGVNEPAPDTTSVRNPS